MEISTKFLVIFTAVFLSGLSVSETVPNSTFLQNAISANSCWQFVHSTGGRIYSHASRGRYANKLDCKVTIVAPPGNRVVIKIEHFDITESLNCYQDEVIFYDGRRNSSPQLSGSLYGLCGTSVPEEYRHMVSSGNEVTVRFITDGVPTDNTGFVLSYTAFIPTINKRDEDQCFQCSHDPMCIDPQLKCDGLANCIDNSDESMELCYDGFQSQDDVTDSSYGWLSWPGTLVAFVFVCCYIISIFVNCVVCCRYKSPSSQYGRREVVITPSKQIRHHTEPSLCQVVSSNVEGGLTIHIDNEEQRSSNRGQSKNSNRCSKPSTDGLVSPSSPRGRGDGSFGLPHLVDEQPGNYVQRPMYPNIPHGCTTQLNVPQGYGGEFKDGRYSGQWSSSSSHHVISVSENY